MKWIPYVLIPILTCACSPEQEEQPATDKATPKKQSAEQAAIPQNAPSVQLPYNSAENLLQIARKIHIDTSWYEGSYVHHATEQIANGVLFAYCNEDESNVQAPELQLECVIKLFLTNYKSAELAWFQATKPEIRIMILATFYCGMNEKLCCFPHFGKFIERCFGEHVSAQRESEWRWVKENKSTLRTVISPLIQQASKLKKDISSDDT